MPRYRDPYEPIDFKKYGEKKPSPEDEKKSKDADLWRFIGSIAPAAGGVLGGVGGGILGGVTAGPAGIVGGAAGGAALGGSLGKMGGDAANAYADEQVREQEVEEDDRVARQRELMSVLMGLRR